MKKRTLPSGIRLKGDKYQAYVRVNGVLKAKTFPLDTPLSAMKTWRLRARLAMQDGASVDGDGPTLAADAVRYLELVESMRTFRDRKYHVRQWVAVFGHRTRASITPLQIRQQLEKWRSTGSSTGGRLSPATLNLRRTALLALYTTLDGKHMPNPVKDVPPYSERESIIDRSQPYDVWNALLGRLKQNSQTRARLTLILWTGLPHQQVMALRPEHIDLESERIYVLPRRKGSGVSGRWLPLLPQAVVAAREFIRLKCWGRFSQPSMHSALERAVAAENKSRVKRRLHPLPKIRPYDARHSFGTMIASIVTDDRSVQEFMLHSTAQQTRRYTEGATSSRLEAAKLLITEALKTQTA